MATTLNEHYHLARNPSFSAAFGSHWCSRLSVAKNVLVWLHLYSYRLLRIRRWLRKELNNYVSSTKILCNVVLYVFFIPLTSIINDKSDVGESYPVPVVVVTTDAPITFEWDAVCGRLGGNFRAPHSSRWHNAHPHLPLYIYVYINHLWPQEPPYTRNCTAYVSGDFTSRS